MPGVPRLPPVLRAVYVTPSVEYQILHARLAPTCATRKRLSGPTCTPVKPTVDVCMTSPLQVEEEA